MFLFAFQIARQVTSIFGGANVEKSLVPTIFIPDRFNVIYRLCFVPRAIHVDR